MHTHSDRDENYIWNSLNRTARRPYVDGRRRYCMFVFAQQSKIALLPQILELLYMVTIFHRICIFALLWTFLNILRRCQDIIILNNLDRKDRRILYENQIGLHVGITIELKFWTKMSLGIVLAHSVGLIRSERKRKSPHKLLWWWTSIQVCHACLNMMALNLNVQ